MSRRTLGVLALLLAATGAGCGPEVPQLTGALRISGSNTVFAFATVLAEGFRRRNPNVSFRVTGDGTARGIKFAGERQVSGLSMPLMSRAFSIPEGNAGPTMNGEPVDIGLSSRQLLNDEREAYTELVLNTFAVDGIAVATHPGVAGVSNLSLTQLRDIYAGRITNWSAVGGPNQPIVVIARNPISGTAGAWQELVMGSDRVTASARIAEMNESVPIDIANTPYSIGYLSIFLLEGLSLNVLAIDNVTPTEANIAREIYPIRRPFIFVTHGPPTALQRAFIDYALSPEGAQLIRMAGAVPVGGTR
jgi:phosphate transport system substrate-binding protein